MKVKDLVRCMVGVENLIITLNREVLFKGSRYDCVYSDYYMYNVVECTLNRDALLIELEEV